MSSNNTRAHRVAAQTDTLTEFIEMKPGLAVRMRFARPIATIADADEKELVMRWLDDLADEIPFDSWGNE